MKTIKCLAIVASSLLIGCFFLMTNTENPLDAKYNAIINNIIEQGLPDNETDILALYPQLAEIKAKIAQLKDLECKISHQTSGQAIPVNEKGESVILDDMKMAQNLKKEIIYGLDSFMSNQELALAK